MCFCFICRAFLAVLFIFRLSFGIYRCCGVVLLLLLLLLLMMMMISAAADKMLLPLLARCC